MKTVRSRDFWDLFLSDFLVYVNDAIPDMKAQVLGHAKDVIRDNASRIKRWMTQASSGALSREDFKWLVQSQMDLSSLNTLKEAGLARVKIDEVRQAFVASLLNSIFKVRILP